jgi:hypothetical protein
MVVGVMVSVPLIAMIWIYVQLTSRGSIRALRLAIRRYRRHVRGAFPSYRNEVALLWSAAVIGGTAAVLLEPFIGGGIEDFIALAPWALPMSCLWLVVIAGQLGMNPILTVTILGSLMPDVTAFGIPAVAIAVGITGGWALTGASSPFTATTVLVGRISGARPIAVGLQWNGVYTIIGGALISFYVTMLALFLGGPNGG